MRPTAIVGVLLIVVGLVVLAYQGITYTGATLRAARSPMPPRRKASEGADAGEHPSAERLGVPR